MKELILLKCGELALKGLNRRTFEEVLMKNCRRRLETLGNFKIRSAQSTIYVEPENEEIDIDEAVDPAFAGLRRGGAHPRGDRRKGL